VEGETHGEFAAASLQAEVEWTVVVSAVTTLNVNVTTVPVRIAMSVEASASGSMFAEAFASAESPFGSVQACQSVGMTSICDGVTTATGIKTLTGSVEPNIPINLIIFAEGGGVEDSKFEAGADPMVTVANAIIPGTDINYQDAFMVALPSGVTQALSPAPASVPEPSSIGLLVVGGTVLAVWRTLMSGGRRERSVFG
jgi:hypothetical protein